MSEARSVGERAPRKVVDRSLCRHVEALADPFVRAATHALTGYNVDHLGNRCSSCWRCRNCGSTMSVPLPGYEWDDPTPTVDVSAKLPEYGLERQDETRSRAGFVPAEAA